MNTTEYTAHFSLWALSKAPLLIGCDVTKMSQDTLTILTNAEVIEVNQDPLGKQGHKVKSANDLEVWAGELSKGAYAVLLFNRSTKQASITAHWTDIGIADGKAFTARDLWKHQDVGQFTSTYTATVPAHGVHMLKLTPA